jgi:hypothetical protein
MEWHSLELSWHRMPGKAVEVTGFHKQLDRFSAKSSRSQPFPQAHMLFPNALLFGTIAL